MADQPATGTAASALDHLVRHDAGRVIAALTRRFARIDLADDAVQEALITASTTWPQSGVPNNPGGWLHVVARRTVLDELRRERSADRRTVEAAPELHAMNEPSDNTPLRADDAEAVDPGDERLRLLLLCCHPAIAPESQVALTLRLVAGLTTEEIAAAFLVPVPTLAQRISRAKTKIRSAGIPMSLPANIGERLGAVLSVLYLTFNEGYLSRSGTSGARRVDLCAEAIRIATVVARLAPDAPEALGLLASLQYTHARRDARFAGDALVLLDDQDRTLWHADEIAAANRVLRAAMDLRRPGPFQIEALIGSYHGNARTAEDTDWARIATLYGQLYLLRPSPVVQLNRAAAIAMADGPLAGLRELDAVEGLDDYHLLHATRGELLARSGDVDDAVVAFRRALELTSNPAERMHLAGRIDRHTLD